MHFNTTWQTIDHLRQVSWDTFSSWLRSFGYLSSVGTIGNVLPIPVPRWTFGQNVRFCYTAASPGQCLWPWPESPIWLITLWTTRSGSLAWATKGIAGSIVGSVLYPACGTSSPMFFFPPSAKSWSAMVYFYGPMVLLILFNITMFVLTAKHIIDSKRTLRKIARNEGRIQKLNSDKQKYINYNSWKCQFKINIINSLQLHTISAALHCDGDVVELWDILLLGATRETVGQCLSGSWLLQLVPRRHYICAIHSAAQNSCTIQETVSLIVHSSGNQFPKMSLFRIFPKQRAFSRSATQSTIESISQTKRHFNMT